MVINVQNETRSENWMLLLIDGMFKWVTPLGVR